MKIIEVVVNGMPLLVANTLYTSNYYKVFMNYYIENYSVKTVIKK